MLKHLLRPDTGRVWIEEEGRERQVDATEVAVGMKVIVGAGATVPVDGTVLAGEALVNEAAMTCEGAPAAKKRGDRALSGTVVEEGRLAIYAEQVGRHTAAARIADYVERSLTAKSRAQIGAAKLADRLVTAVLALAGGAWLMAGDWRRAASVLQADYSCALKLATPVAFKSAMYRAGRSGILFKGADVLERLAETDTFVFDKTGTLTTGRLAVTDSVTFDPAYTPGDLIDLAASVEEHYFHPLALAVVEAARKHHGRHFDHQEVEFIAAHGVASSIEGRRIVVGSRHFVEEDEGIPVDAKARRTIARLYRQGKTLLHIGFGGQLVGVIALKDELREAAPATLARLRRLGIKRILMLTGDHHERAAELADALGLDGYYAQLLPHEKADIVARLAAEGARIAFVGDGINDAPALAGAHCGIAMSNGADLARLTSDIALLEDRLERVADAKEAANATMGLIGTNYRLTLAANTGILAAAAAGRLTPVATSVLHNGSTIAILLRALLGGASTGRSRGGRRRHA
jgi:heavy metal translocating P-type ATPase